VAPKIKDSVATTFTATTFTWMAPGYGWRHPSNSPFARIRDRSIRVHLASGKMIGKAGPDRTQLT
jgi:hypothetical protein